MTAQEIFAIFETALSSSRGADSTENTEPTGTYAAQGLLPAEDLVLTVTGLGEVPLPLPATWGQDLYALSTPARFGRREETLLDPAVRHTGEIESAQVNLQWQGGALEHLQRTVACALGLGGLRLSLHNLLVYGPGQFFKPHQDTEKQAGMVATVVLVAPSAHIGGDLQLSHGQGQKTQKMTLVSEQLAPSTTGVGAPPWRWLAFYADCRHEILPVREGWRVALSFDAILNVDAADTEPTRPSSALAAAWQGYFDLAPATTEKREWDQPWVLMLDHEYSQHGLRWSLLKGRDRQYAALIRSTAQTLGLSVHLALLEWHESWTAYEDNGYHGKRGKTPSEPQPQPQDLIDESVALDFWVDETDEVCSERALNIPQDCVVGVMAMGSEHLSDEQYEGYMGNYGETIDYWYRRAAVVVQSPLSQLRTRFATQFDTVLAELVQAAHAVNPDTGLVDVSTLQSTVRVGLDALRRRVQEKGHALFDRYATIARALTDEPLVMQLMEPFSVHGLTVEHMPALAALEKTHGPQILQQLLRRWSLDPTAQQRSHPLLRYASDHQALSNTHWPNNWSKCLQAALNAALSPNSAQHWLSLGVLGFEIIIKDLAEAPPASQQLRGVWLTQQLSELTFALKAVPNSTACACTLIDTVVQVSSQHAQLLPLHTLASFVIDMGPLAYRRPADQSIGTRVEQALQYGAESTARAVDDHRILGSIWRCHCKDCQVAIDWVESAQAQDLHMPMAEHRRGHVSAEMLWSGADIHLSTLKQGSPYKLILTKSRNLHAKDAQFKAACQQAILRLRAAR